MLTECEMAKTKYFLVCCLFEFIVDPDNGDEISQHTVGSHFLCCVVTDIC